MKDTTRKLIWAGVRLVTVGGIVGAVALAYQLGRKHEYEFHSAHIDDQLARINTTGHILLDMSMRNYHYNAHDNKVNPWCPECHELYRRHLRHATEVLRSDKPEAIVVPAE